MVIVPEDLYLFPTCLKGINLLLNIFYGVISMNNLEIGTTINVLQAKIRPLAYKKGLTAGEAVRLKGYLTQLDQAVYLRDLDRAKARVKAEFDRDPTQEEQLYTDAANNLIGSLARWHRSKIKPARVRIYDIPKALERDGSCNVADYDEFRISVTNQSGEPRQLEVFYHEVKHAIDAVDPKYWEYLCSYDAQEPSAARGEKDLAERARKAVMARRRRQGRIRPPYGVSVEFEKILALAEDAPQAGWPWVNYGR